MPVNASTQGKAGRCAGVTLIELLVAMGTMSIIMTVVVASYWAQTQIGRDQQLVVEMQQNLRSAMFILTRDIMMAGYDNDKNNPPTATIVRADPDEFSFQFIDGTNTRVTVAYSLYDSLNDGDQDLGRSIDGGDRQAVAENIQAIEFFYTLDDGRQSTDPTALSPAANLGQIRSVGVSLLARTAFETRTRDEATYTLLSGTVIGPFNDRFKRQLVTTTIRCRNMIDD